MKPGIETQYAITGALSLTAAAIGIFSGWATPMVSKMKDGETNISKEAWIQYVDWLSYTSPFGYVLGTLVTLLVCDRYGRRHILLISAVFSFCGTILTATANSAWMLHAVSVLWSMSSTMVTAAMAIYLAEIADPDVRGRFYAITRTLTYVGTLISVGIGPLVSYRGFNFWLLFLPLLYCGACYKIPESPYFLVKRDRIDEAKNVLLLLRKDTLVDSELEEMKSHVQKEMQGSRWFAIFRPRNLKAVAIVYGLWLIQKMSGITVLQNYYFDFLNESDLRFTYDDMFATFLGVDCIGGIISVLLVDYVGRRKLLLCSYMGCSISLAIVGSYYYLRDVVLVHPDTLKIFGLVVFIGIVIFVFMACIGWYTLLNLFLGEMFPINVKVTAVVLLQWMTLGMSYLVRKMFRKFEDIYGRAGIVWLYASMAFIGAVFTFFMLPETKGKSLKKIQDMLHGDERNENGQEMRVINNSIDSPS